MYFVNDLIFWNYFFLLYLVCQRSLEKQVILLLIIIKEMIAISFLGKQVILMFAFPRTRLSYSILGLTKFCNKLLLRSSNLMGWASAFLYSFLLSRIQGYLGFFPLSSGLSFPIPVNHFVSQTLFPNNYSHSLFLMYLTFITSKIYVYIFFFSCVFYHK